MTALPYSSAPVGMNTLTPLTSLHTVALNLGLPGPGKKLNLGIQRPPVPRAEVGRWQPFLALTQVVPHKQPRLLTAVQLPGFS